jgi:ribonuclease HI
MNIQIVVDGGCEGNNAHVERRMYGSMAVLRNGKPVEFRYTGIKTTCYKEEIAPVNDVSSNNVAELVMLQHALFYANELLARWAPGVTDVVYIVSDSEVALGWVKGTNKCRAKHLKELVFATSELAKNLRIQLVNKPREFSMAILGH